MRVHNVHTRRIPAPAGQVGALFSELGGPQDGLWPSDRWPRMRLDRPGVVGARGGHGPVRYRLAEIGPASAELVFEPRGLAAGLNGSHRFSAHPLERDALLRHEIRANCGPLTFLLWLAVIEPLHDALIEDAFDRAERRFGGVNAEAPRKWSLWVRLLRGVLECSRRHRAPVAGAT